MNIINPVKYIIHTLCLAWAITHAVTLHATMLHSEPVSSLEYYTSYTHGLADSSTAMPEISAQTTGANNKHNFFRRENKRNSERAGSFVYKSIDDLNKVINQTAGTVLLYGLDGVGLGESVREGVEFIKKNTRYSFGDCADLKLNPGKLTAASCMADGGNVELNSDYDFDAVSVKFRWPL